MTSSKEQLEAEATLERLDGGFARVHNWVFDRVKSDHLNPGDLGVYTFLQKQCNWSTGIYRGTASNIAAQCFDNPKLAQPILRSMRKLRASQLINYPEGKGSYYNYDVLIHGFEPTSGNQKGLVLNAWHHGVKCVPFYQPKSEGNVEGNSEGDVAHNVASDVAGNLVRNVARGGKYSQMSQTSQIVPDVSDVSDEQSKAAPLGLAQLVPQSGQNGNSKDNNKCNNSGRSPNPLALFPVCPDVDKSEFVWKTVCSVPFDENDLHRLWGKWKVTIEKTGYDLSDFIVFTWSISHHFQYLTSSAQFEADFVDVLQKFNNYRSKCSPTQFNKTIMEAWERVSSPESQESLASYLNGEIPDPATPDCAVAPVADANVFDGISDDDDEF